MAGHSQFKNIMHRKGKQDSVRSKMFSKLAREITGVLQSLRRMRLAKHPGVAESLDWAAALIALHADHLDETIVRDTMGCFLKDDGDFQVLERELAWLRRHVGSQALQSEPPRLSIEQASNRLTFRLHQQIGDSEGGGDWLIIMQEVSDESVIEAMALSFKLTPREAEVLYWVVKGKINRDIGDILGSSPMTVKKHLERVFAKLGVETRTAAAAMAMSRIRQLHPQFEQ